MKQKPDEPIFFLRIKSSALKKSGPIEAEVGNGPVSDPCGSSALKKSGPIEATLSDVNVFAGRFRSSALKKSGPIEAHWSRQITSIDAHVIRSEEERPH